MDRILMKSKLHRLTVTETNVDYEGSISIDKDLLKASDIIVGEQVHVINLNNAARFETYAIEGKPGEVCLNGGAARLATPGDRIIVISYALVNDAESKTFIPKIILVNKDNAVVSKKG